ncbi:type II secretion system F family protein [Sphingopyxis sp.]|uniref:type II secretion system F family protein n=1 Tax=Sphingopyxis sp. TaxID=1908224 RepID=UPI002B4A05EC|nr:type II secretion system F family protein [Sphingopyxis sp.]HJS13093.1 type II secretion system F family protein [Sphingopyxis sp.]
MVEILASSPYLRLGFLALLFVTVSSLVYFGVRLVLSRRAVLGRLETQAVTDAPRDDTDRLRAADVRSGTWAKLAANIERSGLSLGDSDPQGLRRRMLAAGYRSPHAPKIYTLLRLLLIFALPSALVVPQLLSETPVDLFKLYLQGAGLALMGLFIPSLFLTAKADRRRHEILDGFPDCLDLMLVCVEAGMGLEAALDRVGREMTLSHPLVAEQISQSTLELRAGASREEALRALANRTGVDEIRAFATLLIQSDKLGSSIATTLRIYAAEMREKRRMRAEEKAHRLPVLLSIPLVACMLPVMIGVLMLPAVIRVIRDIAPALAGGN